MKKLRVVAYLRRSTKGQSESIEDQREAIARFVAEHGYKLVGEYVDDGISGDEIENAPAFERCGTKQSRANSTR